MSEPVSATNTCPPLTLEQLDNQRKIITDFLNGVEEDGRVPDRYTQSWSIDTIGASGQTIRVVLDPNVIKTRNPDAIRSEIEQAIDRLKKQFRKKHAPRVFDGTTFINVSITWSGNHRYPIRAPVVRVPLLGK